LSRSSGGFEPIREEADNVAVALDNALRALLAIAGAGQRPDLKLHQAFLPKAARSRRVRYAELHQHWGRDPLRSRLVLKLGRGASRAKAWNDDFVRMQTML
jgi:hypothetical protein